MFLGIVHLPSELHLTSADGDLEWYTALASHRFSTSSRIERVAPA
jgi:hypothetical protein